MADDRLAALVAAVGAFHLTDRATRGVVIHHEERVLGGEGQPFDLPARH